MLVCNDAFKHLLTRMPVPPRIVPGGAPCGGGGPGIHTAAQRPDHPDCFAAADAAQRLTQATFALHNAYRPVLGERALPIPQPHFQAPESSSNAPEPVDGHGGPVRRRRRGRETGQASEHHMESAAPDHRHRGDAEASYNPRRQRVVPSRSRSASSSAVAAVPYSRALPDDEASGDPHHPHSVGRSSSGSYASHHYYSYPNHTAHNGMMAMTTPTPTVTPGLLPPPPRRAAYRRVSYGASSTASSSSTRGTEQYHYDDLYNSNDDNNIVDNDHELTSQVQPFSIPTQLQHQQLDRFSIGNTSVYTVYSRHPSQSHARPSSSRSSQHHHHHDNPHDVNPHHHQRHLPTEGDEIVGRASTWSNETRGDDEQIGRPSVFHRLP